MLSWPHALEPATGPMPAERIAGVAAGMGDDGPATAGLIEAGWLSPDLMCSMGLFILARQPKAPDPGKSEGPTKASPITGSVWVREQCVVRSPVRVDESFTVEGENLARFARKERRYTTSIAETVGADGRRVGTNVTTGLTSYRPVPGLADEWDGRPADGIAELVPDHSVAAANPHLDAIGDARPGDTFDLPPIDMTLAMMVARDTSASDNPIHSDPEQARAAGLDRPIAGGNHVLSFALEPLLATWGAHALGHGALIDTRWKAPTKADDTMLIRGQVTSVTTDSVAVDVAVELLGTGDPVVALLSRVVVPLPVT